MSGGGKGERESYGREKVEDVGRIFADTTTVAAFAASATVVVVAPAVTATALLGVAPSRSFNRGKIEGTRGNISVARTAQLGSRANGGGGGGHGHEHIHDGDDFLRRRR
jgi:hypothetical protein